MPTKAVNPNATVITWTNDDLRALRDFLLLNEHTRDLKADVWKYVKAPSGTSSAFVQLDNVLNHLKSAGAPLRIPTGKDHKPPGLPDRPRLYLHSGARDSFIEFPMSYEPLFSLLGLERRVTFHTEDYRDLPCGVYTRISDVDYQPNTTTMIPTIDLDARKNGLRIRLPLEDVGVEIVADRAECNENLQGIVLTLWLLPSNVANRLHWDVDVDITARRGLSDGQRWMISDTLRGLLTAPRVFEAIQNLLNVIVVLPIFPQVGKHVSSLMPADLSTRILDHRQDLRQVANVVDFALDDAGQPTVTGDRIELAVRTAPPPNRLLRSFRFRPIRIQYASTLVQMVPPRSTINLAVIRVEQATDSRPTFVKKKRRLLRIHGRVAASPDGFAELQPLPGLDPEKTRHWHDWPIRVEVDPVSGQGEPLEVSCQIRLANFAGATTFEGTIPVNARLGLEDQLIYVQGVDKETGEPLVLEVQIVRDEYTKGWRRTFLNLNELRLEGARLPTAIDPESQRPSPFIPRLFYLQMTTRRIRYSQGAASPEEIHHPLAGPFIAVQRPLSSQQVRLPHGRAFPLSTSVTLGEREPFRGASDPFKAIVGLRNRNPGETHRPDDLDVEVRMLAMDQSNQLQELLRFEAELRKDDAAHPAEHVTDAQVDEEEWGIPLNSLSAQIRLHNRGGQSALDRLHELHTDLVNLDREPERRHDDFYQAHLREMRIRLKMLTALVIDDQDPGAVGPGEWTFFGKWMQDAAHWPAEPSRQYSVNDGDTVTFPASFQRDFILNPGKESIGFELTGIDDDSGFILNPDDRLGVTTASHTPGKPQQAPMSGPGARGQTVTVLSDARDYRLTYRLSLEAPPQMRRLTLLDAQGNVAVNLGDFQANQALYEALASPATTWHGSLEWICEWGELKVTHTPPASPATAPLTQLAGQLPLQLTKGTHRFLFRRNAAFVAPSFNPVHDLTVRVV